MGRTPIFLEVPCAKQMHIDPMPTASMLETVVGDYLAPPAKGIYFRGRVEPIMKFGEVYHQHKTVDGKPTKDSFVVMRIEELDRQQPVYDLDGNVVVGRHQIPFLSYEAMLPVTALQIVETAVRSVIESKGVEEYCKPQESADQLYRQFLHPLVLQNRDEELIHAVIMQIVVQVSELRVQALRFCGESKWELHFLRKHHTELIVEKSIDWRIIEYHRLTGTKPDYEQ